MDNWKEFLVKLHKLYFRLKVWLRNIYRSAMTWIGWYFPIFILRLIMNPTIDGYTGDNIRMLWYLKFVSDKHSKLKEFYSSKPITFITFTNITFKKHYAIDVNVNKYVCLYRDNGSSIKRTGRFSLNTIRFDELKVS